MDGDDQASATARLERLQLVTSALSRAATVRDVTEVALTTVREGIEAQAALLALLGDDGRELLVVDAVGYLESTAEQWRSFPVDAPLPAGDALRSGRTVSFESVDDRDRQYPALRGAPSAHESYLVVPLLVDGTEPVGILSFGFTGPRTIDDGQRAFVEAVADQCAQAIHRARLFDEQRSLARARGFLNQAGRLLAEARSFEEVVQRSVTVPLPELADGAALYLRVPGGLTRVATWHVDPGQREALRAVTSRRQFSENPVLYRALKDDEPTHVTIDRSLLGQFARDDDHLVQLRGLDLSSALVLPLRPRSRAIGVLALVGCGGRDFDAGDRTLAESYASLAALHCDNVKLLDEQTRIARRLQASLLPPMLPEIAGLEIAATYAAAGLGSEVGGDFYDVFQVGQGRWFALTGDVRGRGVEAAATTGLARHTIRAAGVPEARPSTVLRRLNDVLLTSEDTGPVLAEPRFCAVCLVALELDGGRVTCTVCCAGHPLPRVLRANGSAHEVGVPGTVAGVLHDPDLTDVVVPLEPGDTLVLYTDGISERRAGSEFFEDRLHDVLTAAAGMEPAALANHLREAATAFAAGEADDDMAVLVLRLAGRADPLALTTVEAHPAVAPAEAGGH